MNRTQKKCVMTATGIHLLLIVIVIVGPAFLSSRNTVDDMPVIEFVPMLTTDKPFSNPGAGSPAPAPTQQQQQVAPPPPKPPVQQTRAERVEAPKPVTPVKSDPLPAPTKVEPKRTLPKVSTDIVRRRDVMPTKTTTTTKTSSQTPDNPSKDFAKAVDRIRQGATSSTEIEMPQGGGGSGPSYANYAQVVKSIYTRAWIAPDGVDDDDATAKVSVTIARDGSVISARLIQSSGSAAVDRSVQSTLDRVTFIAPFPEGSKDRARTYKINFNLKAKQLLG